MGSTINVVNHYTSVDVLSKIIDKQQLRFTNLSFLNDKSEYIYALQLLKNKITEFEIENNLTNKLNLKLFDKFSFKNELYSVSFSEDGDSLGFWNSYYVPKNEGISLGFEVSQLFPSNEFKINKCIYGDPYSKMSKERYIWFRQLFNDISLQHKNIEYIQIIFQTAHIKDIRFQIENEWRSIVFAPKNLMINYFKRGGNLVPYFDYPINIKSLSNIVIGPSSIQDKIFQNVKTLIKNASLETKIEKSTIPFNL